MWKQTGGFAFAIGVGVLAGEVAVAQPAVRLGEFQVNTYTSGPQRYPAVAMDADGDFVVVWQSNQQDGNSDGIFAQRFNAAGLPQASEFKVNFHISGAQ